MRSTAVLVLLLALAAPARATVWRRPLEGPLLRAFAYGPDPFRRGWHRGVDLAAGPGAAVRAACSGTVVTARVVAGAEGVVTLLCGRWRVTHLPLIAIAVHPGMHVRAGARLGLLGTSSAHAGLHLGVRRAGDPFGYVNPMRFLHGHRPPGPPPLLTGRGGDLGPPPPPAGAPAPATAAAAPLAPRPQPASSGAAPVPRAHWAPGGAAPAARAHSAPGGAAPVPRAHWASAGVAPVPRAHSTSGGAAPVPRAHSASGGAALGARPHSASGGAGPAARPRAVPGGVRRLAPWPAWAGLALLLSGAMAGGVRFRRRRGRAAVSLPAAEGVP